MFWADKVVERIRERYGKLIEAGEPLVLRDEKTASGRVHVGSLRGVAIHGVVSEILAEQGVRHTFLYEINDMDPMDDIPGYLDDAAYRPYLFRALKDIPSPSPQAPNFAEHFGREFMGVIEGAGFAPTFYRASELYESGRMNEAVKTALTRRDLIRDIYQRVSGSTKEVDWLPISLVRHACALGEIARPLSFDGSEVTYVCLPQEATTPPRGAPELRVSPYSGNAKLPWKVDWAAKFKVLGVHVEGGGKDHSTKSGARDVANALSREVFEHEPPLDLPYEFFLVGGQKMSSSKGRGSSAREIADLVPPEILRLALLGKDPMQAVNFVPEGDTIPVLYDTYDRFAENYWSGANDAYARLFVLLHHPERRATLPRRFLPRFSLIAFMVQMPHLDIFKEVEALKGAALTEDDRREVDARASYAKKWLERCAPEQFRFVLQRETVPSAAASFTAAQKAALSELLVFIEKSESLSGEALHGELHRIKEARGLAPADLFGALYVSFLGKTSGPKAGWFLSVLDRNFLITRLREVTR